MLAGVRVQPGHGQPGRRQPESRELGSRELDGVFEPRLRQRLGHLAQRHVDRRQHHSQRVRIEHHRHAARPGEVSEQLGVPRPGQSRGCKRFLVDRRSRDRIDPARPCVLDRAHDGLVRRTPGRCGHASAFERVGRHRPVHNRLADAEHARVAGRFRRDFRADARGIARRDPDPRPPVHRRNCALISGIIRRLTATAPG